MTTITLTLTMPDELAAQAKEVGIFSSSALLQMIRREVQERRIERFFQAADRLASVNDPPMTISDLSAEISAARSERRKRYASGS